MREKCTHNTEVDLKKVVREKPSQCFDQCLRVVWVILNCVVWTAQSISFALKENVAPNVSLFLGLKPSTNWTFTRLPNVDTWDGSRVLVKFWVVRICSPILTTNNLWHASVSKGYVLIDPARARFFTCWCRDCHIEQKTWMWKHLEYLRVKIDWLIDLESHVGILHYVLYYN